MSVNKFTIATILAVGLVLALNFITFGVLYDAIVNPGQAGLSENATQILTGWGGGVIGILGTVFGYTAGANDAAGGEGVSRGESSEPIDDLDTPA